MKDFMPWSNDDEPSLIHNRLSVRMNWIFKKYEQTNFFLFSNVTGRKIIALPRRHPVESIVRRPHFCFSGHH